MGGTEGRGRLGSALARSVGVRCRTGAWAALARTGTFLLQAEWPVGTGPSAGAAGRDLQEARFQLPTGTRPALKRSAADRRLS